MLERVSNRFTLIAKIECGYLDITDKMKTATNDIWSYKKLIEERFNNKKECRMVYKSNIYLSDGIAIVISITLDKDICLVDALQGFPYIDGTKRLLVLADTDDAVAVALSHNGDYWVSIKDAITNNVYFTGSLMLAINLINRNIKSSKLPHPIMREGYIELVKKELASILLLKSTDDSLRILKAL